MKNYFGIINIFVRQNRLFLLFAVLLALPISFFQNCAKPMLEVQPVENPNRNPVDDIKNSAGVIVDPGMIKSKMIGGVEVPGFEAGAWLYLMMNDQCVMDRKNEIINQKLYLADAYLATHFDFTKPVGSYNVSLIAVKTTSFISEEEIDNASRADECIINLTVSNTYFEVSPSQGVLTGGSSLAWNDIRLSNPVLNRLSAIHNNKKVNVGLSVFGISQLSGLPFSSNIAGTVWEDLTGEGTYLASVIAGPLHSGIEGAAKQVAQITPSIISNGILTPISLFRAIKDLVNRGAEVILLPQEIVPNEPSFCHSTVGQALYYAVERGTTVVVQAGTETLTGRGPGEIIGPRDYNLWEKAPTNFPACWSRYFRGVISVGGKVIGADSLVSNSNWGVEGVELLAPGHNVVALSAPGRISKLDGPAASAALATSAVAHIISFFKAKGWYYNPWLIEDILINGSRISGSLPGIGKSVRLNRILDFDVLTTYLEGLNTKTEAETRRVVTDNPEANQGINLSSIGSAELPIKLDVFTKESDVFLKDRSQFQAVLYYASGAVKVVTNQVSWATSDPINFPIDPTGVVSPARTGAFTINAVDSATGLSASYSSIAVDYDRISGQTGEISEVFLVPENPIGSPDSFTQIDKTSYRFKGANLAFRVRARYANGEVRSISEWASYAFSYNGQSLHTYSPIPGIGDTIRFNGDIQFYGGVENDLFIFYRGQKFSFRIVVDSYRFLGWYSNLRMNPYHARPSIIDMPLTEKMIRISDTEVHIFKDVLYFPDGATKKPLCEFGDGDQSYCPGYSSSHRIIDAANSTLMNDPGYRGRFTPGTEGTFNLWHQMEFRGSGTSERQLLNLKVIVKPVVLETVTSHLAFDLRTTFVQNIKPNGSHTPNINQLTPACMSVGYELLKVNAGLGISQFYRTVAGWAYNPAEATAQFQNAGVPTGDSIRVESGKEGFLVKDPITPINLKFSTIETSSVKSLDTTTIFTADPMNPNLSGFNELATLAPATLNSLPSLPPIKTADPDCAGSVDPETGFKRGDGQSPETAFLLCSIEDFAKASAVVSPQYTIYLVLGNNISLSGQTPMLRSSGEKTFLHSNANRSLEIDGNFYTISNAEVVDREARFSLLTVSRAKNLVFSNNRVTALSIDHLSSKASFAEGIYSYDNIFESDDYRGISSVASAKNSFTKNRILYREYAYSIAHKVLNSFSQDDVRYIGIVGRGYYYGLGMYVAYSGSASKISNGGWIGGVANEFCYRCYSKVEITATNSIVIGGIVLNSMAGIGNVELGVSEANITAVGNTVIGGLIGTVEYHSSSVRNLNFFGKEVTLGFGHVHIMKSNFSGRIFTSGTAGGFIGQDKFYSNPTFSDSRMLGTLNGEVNAKLGAYIGIMTHSCQSEKRVLRTRGNTIQGALLAVGNYYGRSSDPTSLVRF